MPKRTRRPPPSEKPSGTWPVSLVAMAAAGRSDGGMGLQHLLEEAGFAEKPAMSIIVKRPRPRTELGELVDPYVDDVLDALRALCA
ncbi:MAG: hypothetical protein JWP87_3953 [Labilithrix sp.]|nr:hypothetical protein [Labilithrix sp.]